MTENLALTTGAGLKNPRGDYTKLPVIAKQSPVQTLAKTLANLSLGEETWWSPHIWENNYRGKNNWRSACGVTIDIDFDDTIYSVPTDEDKAALEKIATDETMPGSLWHATPKGGRLIALFKFQCHDKDLLKKTARGLGILVSEKLINVPYFVDPQALEDLARLFYAPNTIAKQKQRNAKVITLRSVLYDPHDLAKYAPEELPTSIIIKKPRLHGTEFSKAVQKWNEDHPVKLPRNSEPCPICKDTASFGMLNNDPNRWFCFSTDHKTGGVKTERGFAGNFLDLEAAKRECSPAQVLREDNYLSGIYLAPPPSGGGEGNNGKNQPITNIGLKRRPNKKGSYLTAVQVIKYDSDPQNQNRILHGKKFEFNKMTGCIELDRKMVCDQDIFALRADIELLHNAGVDSKGFEVGLSLSLSDVQQACEQVAYERSFHPVQDYLNSLQWDHVNRLDDVIMTILSAEDKPLNRSMFRRFMISAVARAMEPGCKVDTVLVLIGEQGVKKSSFFKALAGEWFVDSAVDIHHKDAFQVLRRAWIYEWAELEVLRRARDAEAAKQFLSSCVDTYRASHARLTIQVPRSSVIVGSTNKTEFLTDDTGNRRFWPLHVKGINLAEVVKNRDQLWAEATYLYHLHIKNKNPLTDESDYQWWLTDEETLLLKEAHKDHVTVDPWDSPIWEWSGSKKDPFTTAEVLEKALFKPKGQWEDRDLKRVSRSLKRGGWKLDANKPSGGSRKWSR